MRRGRPCLIFLPLSLTKARRKREPIAPLIKESRAEERGMCLLKMPIVPKISMEEASISMERGELPPDF